MSLEFLVKGHALLKAQGSAEGQLTFKANETAELYLFKEAFLFDSKGRDFAGLVISN